METEKQLFTKKDLEFAFNCARLEYYRLSLGDSDGVLTTKYGNFDDWFNEYIKINYGK